MQVCKFTAKKRRLNKGRVYEDFGPSGKNCRKSTKCEEKLSFFRI